MRQIFTAKVRWLELKNTYKSIDLPYRSVALIEIKQADKIIDGLPFTTYISYSKTLHKLELKAGDILQFTAELDWGLVGRGLTYIFIRPSRYTKQAI